MAHGPKIGTDYAAPQCFNAAGVDADVFQRWTPAFGPHLRMVCGGSTFLGYVAVGEIWNYLLEAQISVADAFVLGSAQADQVPVCLARGGRDPSFSALADRKLHTDQVVPRGWLHLQYPVRCTVERNGSTLQVGCGKPPAPVDKGETAPYSASNEAPILEKVETLPVVTTSPLPAPALPRAQFDRHWHLGFVSLPEHEYVKFHPDSGAVVLIKRRDHYSRLKQCDQETRWTVRPSVLLEKAGLEKKFLTPAFLEASGPRRFVNALPTAFEMRIESRPDGAPSGSCTVRSLFLLLHTEVNVGTKSNPKRYPIFGPALVLEFQRGETDFPMLASFNTPRRDLKVVQEKVQIKREADAIRDTYQELQLKPTEYAVNAARAVLGYEEAPLRCRQESLRPTYEIRFFPTESAQDDRPTIVVRRDARREPGKASWECAGWGEEGNEAEP